MGSRVRSRWRGPRPSAPPSQKPSGRGTLLHPQVRKGQASKQNSSGLPYWVCITSYAYPQHAVAYKEGSHAFADGLWTQSLVRVHFLVALLIWELVLKYGLLLGVADSQPQHPSMAFTMVAFTTTGQGLLHSCPAPRQNPSRGLLNPRNGGSLHNGTGRESSQQSSCWT